MICTEPTKSKALCSPQEFFFLDFIFLSSFRFTANWAESPASSHTLCLHRYTAFPTANILNQMVHLLKIHGTTLTHRYHPKTICFFHEASLLVVHILRVLINVWWHISTIVVSCKIASLSSKSSVLCLFRPLSPLTPGNHWSFYCLCCFAFSKMSYNSKTSSVCRLFRMVFFSQ